MKTQLQRIRKEKGFKSAKAFAEHIGMSKNTYTNYEQGTRPLSLETAWEFADALECIETAWEFADALECTLDELAGREWPRPAFADPGQEALNAYFESMNSAGRGALVESARLMSGSPDTRIEKDRAAPAGVQAEERSA